MSNLTMNKCTCIGYVIDPDCPVCGDTKKDKLIPIPQRCKCGMQTVGGFVAMNCPIHGGLAFGMERWGTIEQFKETEAYNARQDELLEAAQNRRRAKDVTPIKNRYRAEIGLPPIE